LSAGRHSPRYRIDVLGRALDVLDVLRQNQGELRLVDIAKAAHLDKSTAFRILHTLEERGYVLRDAGTKRFQLPLRYRKYRVGYAELSSKERFSQEVTRGLVEAARKYPVELLVTDNEFSAEKALNNAAWLIQQKVDFVIEYQAHYRIAPQLAAMFAKAHIPTMAIDIPQPGAIYFGVDNYAAGWMAGEALARFAQKKWSGHVSRVILLEIPRAGRVPQSRMLGIVRGLEHVLPNLKGKGLVHRGTLGTESSGYQATRRVLCSISRREHLLVAAANDSCARGALRAVRETHWEDYTAIMGQGWDPHPLLTEEIRKGESPVIGTIAYFPEKYGAKILPTVLKCFIGRPVPPAVHTKHALVTKENIDKLLRAREHDSEGPRLVGELAEGSEPTANTCTSLSYDKGSSSLGYSQR
jgi:ribose transport system substrate-binding protein